MSDHLLVRNAADPKQVKRGKQTEKWRAERDQLDLHTILDTLTGRRFLWRLLCEAGCFRSIHAATEFDRGVQEGKRRMGLEVMNAIMQLNPDLYHRMAKEAHDLNEATKPNIPEQPLTTKETDDEYGNDTD